MARVFAALAAANVILLAGTAALGLLGVDDNADRHVLLAVLTLLLSCFVQVVVFTYFTVTGKLVGQAVHLAKRGLTAVHEARRIKRSATHGVAIVVASLMPVIVTGAVAWRTQDSTTWHVAAVFLLVAAHAMAFRREYSLIQENTALVSRAIDDYTSRERDSGDVPDEEESTKEDA